MSPDYQLDDMALQLRFDILPLRATANDLMARSLVTVPAPSLRSRSVMLRDTFRAKASGYRDGWYINDADSNDIANVG
jgi:hypothetical protein